MSVSISMARKGFSLVKYKITVGLDGFAHIFEYDSESGEYSPQIRDLNWEGLLISVDPTYLQKELHCYFDDKKVGDEIVLVGRKFIILEINAWTMQWICTPATVEGYRLLLHQLVFKAELYKLNMDAFLGMSSQMRRECSEDLMNAVYRR